MPQPPVLAFPDFLLADPAYAQVKLTGGGWDRHRPLTNLLKEPFAYVARSVDFSLNSTKFWVDLGIRRDVRVIAIPRCNGTQTCMIRVRGFSAMDESSTPDVDGDFSELYPRIYPRGSLYYGHPSFYDGRMSEEDRKLYPMPWYVVFDAPKIARYWLVEVDDRRNRAKGFQFPSITFARGYQPSLGIPVGSCSMGTDDPSIVTTSIAQADFIGKRTKRRTARFTLTTLPLDEGLVWIHDMQARLGVSGRVFFIFDPDDVAHRHRRTFLARMRQINPLEYAAYGLVNAAFDMIEVVA